MRTIDTNPLHKLALVQDSEAWHSADANTRYVALDEAPALEKEALAETYLRQLHYVASHVAVGLFIHDRVDAQGARFPRTGWMRWKP